MSRATGLRHLAIALALVCVTDARAQVSQDQAQALEQQIKAWFSDLTSGLIDPAQMPFRIAAEGDRYRVEIPLPPILSPSGPNQPPLRITALVHPLGGQRWAIDDVRVPQRLQLAVPTPPPAGPMAMSMSIAEQSQRGVLDLSFATTSTLDGEMSGLNISTRTPEGNQTGTVGRVAFHQAWEPAAGGTVDMKGQSVLQRYQIQQPMPGPRPAQGAPPQAAMVQVSMDEVRATGELSRFDFAALGTVIRTATSLAVLAQRTDKMPSGGGMPPEAQAGLHRIIDAIFNLTAGGEAEETLQGLRVQGPGFTAQLQQLGFVVGFGAPGGKTDVHVRYTIDGPDSPMIPPGFYREYLPRHAALGLRVSGVAKDDLVRLAHDAIDKGPAGATDELQGETMALLARSPVAVGAEVALDLGAATLNGVGELDVAGPQQVSGHSEIKVTGLDQLMGRINQMPEFQEAGPFLAFLKGLGAQEGDTTVWRIAFADNKLTVNGQDMSQMMGGPPPR